MIDAGRVRPEVHRYAVRLDRGEFWLAHEELEPLWLRERCDALQGLILLAAALLHAERGNRGGAITKASASLGLLDGASLPDLDVEPIRAGAASLLERIQGSDGEHGGLGVSVVECLRGVVDRGDGPGEVELPYRVARYDEGYRTGRDPRRRD